jgi:hypothetical protein
MNKHGKYNFKHEWVVFGYRDLKVMDCIEYATRMWVLNQMNELIMS